MRFYGYVTANHMVQFLIAEWVIQRKEIEVEGGYRKKKKRFLDACAREIEVPSRPSGQCTYNVCTLYVQLVQCTYNVRTLYVQCPLGSGWKEEGSHTSE